MPTSIVAHGNAANTFGFAQRKVARMANGVLWEQHNNGSDSTEFRYSVDNGTTWTQDAGATVAGTARADLFIDQDDYVWLVWRQTATVAGRTAGNMYVMRGVPNAGRTAIVWGTPKIIGTNAAQDYPTVVAARRPGSSPTTWDAFVVSSLFTGAGINYTLYTRIPVAADGTLGTAVADGLGVYDSGTGYTVGILGGSYGVATYTHPSIDFHHAGDGKTVQGGTPHLYVGWSAGTSGAGKGLRFRKAVYSAGAWTWNAEREIDPDRYAHANGQWLLTQFDGTRVTMAGFLSDTTSGAATPVDVVLHERDAADTTTTTRVLIDNAPAADALMYGSAGYDSAGNVYLAGRASTGAAGTRPLNHRRWTRAGAGAGLGPATTFDASGPDLPYLSIGRGHNGNAVRIVYTDTTVIAYEPIVLNRAPNAPALVAPANASSQPLAAGFTFDWTYSDPDAGDTQASYAFRRKIAGAASYEYWNASTGAWQSTEVYNPSTADQVTFPANAWTTGQVYNWSVSTRDALGDTGPYATDFTVTAGQPPSVTVTAPSGTVTTATRPPVTWSYSDPEGDPQATYEVRIFTAAQYGAGGFSPGTSAPAVGSGEIASANARSWTPTQDLVNGTTYRAYVRVSQSGGQYSAWAFSGFTLNLTTPTAPTLQATVDTANSRVTLVVTGTDPGPQFTAANTHATVERSTDGGATWKAVRGGSRVPFLPNYTVTIHDYEAPPAGQVQYRAFAGAEV